MTISLQSVATQVLDDWYSRLDLYQDKLPSKGSIAAALHVLNRLQSDYNSEFGDVAGGESQITGLSAASLRKVLAEFGETRAMSSVGGRSNRGTRGAVAVLLAAMKPLGLATKPEKDRIRCSRRCSSISSHIMYRAISP